MNKKRKILTMLGMIAFVVIILTLGDSPRRHANLGAPLGNALAILIVVYAGLFAMLSERDAFIRRAIWHWRRAIAITGVIVAGLGIMAGFSAAIIASHAEEKRKQQARVEAMVEAKAAEQRQIEAKAKAKHEEERRHMITKAEIEFSDLELESNRYFHTSYTLKGRIRNRSKYTMASVTLCATLLDASSGEVIGTEYIGLEVSVPRAKRVRCLNTLTSPMRLDRRRAFWRPRYA